jgi:Arc/MetJ-type ribon-helix-helix transcriptional regulator
MPMSQESKVTIKIPRALYRSLRDIIQDSGFNSVTDFIVYVLRDVASSEEARKGASDPPADPAQLTVQEVEKLKQRLKNLGYL